MKTTISLSLMTVIFSSGSIYAQDQASGNSSNDIYIQQTSTVTASRYEQNQDDVIPSISIISREDIDNLQANNILDLLALQQGIDIARNGGPGSATSVFMRGTNSNHSLVLIDGMRTGSSFTGSFAWEHLPVAQIERIEIVRGTRVSYYGSDAIGGVINIITRQQDRLSLNYTQGSFGTNNASLGIGQSYDKGQFSITLASQHSDGFSATNENNLFSYNPDEDGYSNINLSFNSLMKFNSGDLLFNYYESKAGVAFDSFIDSAFSNSKERVTRLAWSSQILTNWMSEISIGNNSNALETRISANGYDSNRLNFDWLLDKSFSNKHVGMGLSYQKETAEYDNFLVNEIDRNNSTNNLATFANWRANFEKNILSLSGRYDHNSAHGSILTGGVDWAHDINEKVRLNFSVANAFHAPNLNELFSPALQDFIYSPELDTFVSIFSFEGNPDLKPEESINYEVGLKSRINENNNLSFNLFYYEIDNLIDFQGPTFRPVNVNESSITGIEANYDYELNGFTLNINATHQNAKNEQDNSTLLRRPDNKANLSIDKFFNKFSIGTSMRYNAKNPDFGIELDGYTVIDLRAAYVINEHWRVALIIENATDKEYQIINGYNTPKNSGYLTIEWKK